MMMSMCHLRQNMSFVEIGVSKKQSSKVWKIITLRSNFEFFSIITTYKKLDEKPKTFIDDLILVVTKGLLLLSTIWKHMDEAFWLIKGPTIGVSSQKTLIKEALPCMMKHTLEKKCFINVIVSITSTSNL